MKNELHIQASLWHGHAVLFLEGEAQDRRNGGGMIEEALYQVALGRGLRLTTDLEHLDLRPVRAWRVRINNDHLVTLEWPHHHPLFEHIPLDLPNAWLPTATEEGLALLFAGYGLGMHEHAHDGESHPLDHLEHAAYTGALAAGAVSVSVPITWEEPQENVAIPTARAPMDEPATTPTATTTRKSVTDRLLGKAARAERRRRQQDHRQREPVPS